MTKEFGAWTIDVPQNSGEAIYNVEWAACADIVFEEGLTLSEAQALVKAYEEEERKNGEYTEGFYAIRNTSEERYPSSLI